MDNETVTETERAGLEADMRRALVEGCKFTEEEASHAYIYVTVSNKLKVGIFDLETQTALRMARTLHEAGMMSIPVAHPVNDNAPQPN
jgi:hypothetical protein